MANELIISISGLRGVVGQSLTAEVAYRYAAALAEVLPPGSVIVTRDGRANGQALVRPVMAGLSHGGGRRLLDGGVAATPTIGVLVRRHGAAGGIQISASHNPPEYNGLKLFAAEGRVVSAQFGEAVLQRFSALTNLSEPPRVAMQDELPSLADFVETLQDPVAAHLELIETLVDVGAIRARRFRVLLDANHGAGSQLGRPLLERLGCRVTLLGGAPDGLFAHPPEPTAENLRTVLDEVTRAGADIGFCQDPDADRLAIVDERGRYLGEEYTLALCVDHVLRRAAAAGELAPVVTNCSTSRMAEDLARKYGAPFYRSAVGEANVVDEMLRRGAMIGGEGNGGVIDPRVVLVRDSFVGMALILAAMAERGRPISALADELPRYAICKIKIEVPRERIPAALDALERHFANAASDRLDGLRLDWPGADGRGSWLLVRASNTEPIVRAIAEAAMATEADRLCREAASVVGGLG